MPRPSKKAQSQAAAKLAEALNFVAPCYKDGGLPFQAHARVAGKWMTATDGTLTAGHPIEEEFAACPHIARFIDALNKAGKTLAITENDNGTLLLKGDKIRAVVPCIPGGDLPQVMPDPNIATIDDRIKEGFAKLLPLTVTEGDRVVEVSILVRANSMFSTNAYVLFEYWHGIDLPPGIVVPKSFAAAIASSTKKLTGFGFSAKSVTFYFEDGAWYKSQIFEEEWPDIDKLFDFPQYPAPVPEGLFEAVKAIDSFSKDGAVHFHDEKLKTTYDNYQDIGSPVYGATYDVPGLQGGHSFTAKLLRLIEPVCAKLDYTSNEDRAFFFDDANVRGTILKRVQAAPDPAPEPRNEWDWGSLPSSGSPMAPEGATAAPSSGWGTGAAPQPETVPPDPNAGAWAAAIGGGNSFGDIEDDDIPF
jgi:hypothetical protein